MRKHIFIFTSYMKKQNTFSYMKKLFSVLEHCAPDGVAGPGGGEGGHIWSHSFRGCAVVCFLQIFEPPNL